MAVPSPSGDDHQGGAEQADQSKPLQMANKIFDFLLKNWLIFGFGLACLLGYLFPHVAAKGGIIRSEYSILYGAIACIFLINGAQLSPEKLKEHVMNWRLHATVQGINLILISVIQLTLVRIIIAAGGVSSGTIDPSILVGMIVVGCIPTTIASNVVMTRNSGGDEAAAIIEVVIGNVAGAFLSPWLIYGFIPKGGVFDALTPAPPSQLGSMYRNVMMQLGLAVLVPLVIGQSLRWIWPKQVLWALRTFYLAPLCSVFMALLAWATFSGAFETGALYTLSTSSVVFNIIFNLVEYLLFTVICYYAAQPPEVVMKTVNPHLADSKYGKRLPEVVKRAITVKRMDRGEAVAVCFCGAAKTTSLGIPLTAAMWSQLDNHTISAIQVPVLLYTVEQVFVAQFLTIFFKKWVERGETKGSHDVESAAGTRESADGTSSVQQAGSSPNGHDQGEITPAEGRSGGVRETHLAGKSNVSG